MVSRPIKVLIVDDSSVSRDLLAFIIDSDPDLKVIGFAHNGEEAIQFLKHQTPDVITMDIVMPKMDGFETTRKLMQLHPIPIIIISNSYKKEDTQKSFMAIEAGALAILEKPRGPNDPCYPETAKAIIDSIKLMAEVRVITRRPYFKPQEQAKAVDIKPSQEVMLLSGIEVVAIGASLGGPQALEVVLSKLPPDFPVPIYIVQHIASGFIHGLANWLNAACTLQVKVAKEGEIGQPGYVYLAPDKVHMEVRKGNQVVLIDEPPEGGLRPAVARLFRSIAESFGPHSIGILLTGMGKDGADDLLTMKQRGAYTIAQNEETCVIFGMPGEAIKLGAAQRIAPLEEIPQLLCKIMKK